MTEQGPAPTPAEIPPVAPVISWDPVHHVRVVLLFFFIVTSQIFLDPVLASI